MTFMDGSVPTTISQLSAGGGADIDLAFDGSQYVVVIAEGTRVRRVTVRGDLSVLASQIIDDNPGYTPGVPTVAIGSNGTLAAWSNTSLCRENGHFAELGYDLLELSWNSRSPQVLLGTADDIDPVVAA